MSRTFVNSRNETIVSDLSDRDAYTVCLRMNDSFASSLCRQFNGRGLTPRQLPYLHQLAIRQLEAERAGEHDTVMESAAPQPEPITPANPLRLQPAARVLRASRDEDEDDKHESTVDAPNLDAPRSHTNLGRLFMLQYDIPLTTREDEAAGRMITEPVYPNPSRRLRRFAIRSSLSVWVVPEGRMPYVLINEMREAGCTVWPVAFDMSDVEQIKKFVEHNLRKEVSDAMERLAESCQRAGDQSSDVKIERHIDNAAKRVNTLIADLTEAANVFGLELGGLMSSTLGKVTALQTESYRRAKVYAAAVKTAREHGDMDSYQLAEAARSDNYVPAFALADSLRDAGQDEAADELQNEFYGRGD